MPEKLRKEEWLISAILREINQLRGRWGGMSGNKDASAASRRASSPFRWQGLPMHG
jgi:hypothetical protein